VQEIISLYRVHRQYLQVESGGGGFICKIYGEIQERLHVFFSLNFFLYSFVPK